MRLEDLFDRQILIVTGKGGTGKSTVAAALAVSAAALGRRTLLVEVEGRGEVARTLGVPDPGFQERPTAQGCSVLSITPQPALVEYLHLFVGMDRLSRPLLRSGVIDQVIGAAPGFRDLLSCGKLYEITQVRRSDPRDRGRPHYDLVVVDAPPTGQIASFLAAPAVFAELARVGRIRRQAAAVNRLLQTRAHVLLVSLLEEMAVAETIEAIPAILATGVAVAGIVANRQLAQVFPRGTRQAARQLAGGDVMSEATRVGLRLSVRDAADLVSWAAAVEQRHRAQAGFLQPLKRTGPVMELPELPGRQPAGTVAALACVLRGMPEPPVPEGRLEPPVPEGRLKPPGRRATPAIGSRLDDLLGEARIVVVCGSGGVGKTTISAAVAIHLAERRNRVALLTVDPARRLATALRLPQMAGERTEVRIGRGRMLEAMQLDTQRTFDELIERHAGSPERRDRILDNKFYRRISDTLAGTPEYMAMEKLHELASEEDHGAIVVDTPPTRSALSFLDAPKRLTDFLGSRFLRWMLAPPMRVGKLSLGFARVGASAFARTVGRLVGAEVLADTADFLAAFEGMYGGFRQRSEEVLDLLRAPDCAFVVVTSPSPQSLEEAGFFLERLAAAGMHARAVVANRWHPGGGRLPDGAARGVADLRAGAPKARAVAALLSARLRTEPQIENEMRAMAAFSELHPTVPIVGVPELTEDVHDVSGLRLLGAHLFEPHA